MAEKKRVITIKGTVYDPVTDCGHMYVSDGNSDILHPALGELEGKEVTVTITVR